MWLSVRSGKDAGRRVEVVGQRFVIGRDASCDLTLDDERISRQHAALETLPDGRIQLRDLGSTNGTTVDGTRVTGTVLLAGTETIELGGTTLEVSSGDATLLAPPGEPAVAETRLAAAPPAPPQTPPPSATPPAAPPSPPPEAAPTPAPRAEPLSVPPSTPSRIERLRLSRSVRRLTLLAAGLTTLVVVGVVVVVLFVTGVIGGDDDGQAQAASVSEIVSLAKPSTVLVNAFLDDELIGGGTGWVYDADRGLIVTNAHVVNAGTTFTVVLGKDERTAEVVGVAPCEDLAVLKVSNATGMKTLPLGSQASLEQGDQVVALGYPINAALGTDLSATAGVVSVVKTRFLVDAIDVPVLPNVIQTDAAINPGNSGGPLVDMSAQLVGVNSANFTDAGGRQIQQQGYAIGVDRVKLVVPKLAEGESQLWTGLNVSYPAVVDLEALGLPTDQSGLVTFGAIAGTPADEAGFNNVATLLVAVDGQALDGTLRSYCDAVEGKQSGDEATFTVYAQDSSEPQDVLVEFV